MSLLRFRSHEMGLRLPVFGDLVGIRTSYEGILQLYNIKHALKSYSPGLSFSLILNIDLI